MHILGTCSLYFALKYYMKTNITDEVLQQYNSVPLSAHTNLKHQLQGEILLTLSVTISVNAVLCLHPPYASPLWFPCSIYSCMVGHVIHPASICNLNLLFHHFNSRVLVFFKPERNRQLDHWVISQVV